MIAKCSEAVKFLKADSRVGRPYNFLNVLELFSP